MTSHRADTAKLLNGRNAFELGLSALRMAVAYILFLWSVVWRSIVVAMSVALLSGVGLGAVASAKGWSETEMTGAANMMGAPIALMAVLGVLALRLLSLKRATA